MILLIQYATMLALQIFFVLKYFSYPTNIIICFGLIFLELGIAAYAFSPKENYNGQMIYDISDTLLDKQKKILESIQHKSLDDKSINDFSDEMSKRRVEFKAIDLTKWDIYHLDLYRLTLLRFTHFEQAIHKQNLENNLLEMNKVTIRQKHLITLTALRNKYQKLSIFEKITVSIVSAFYLALRDESTLQ